MAFVHRSRRPMRTGLYLRAALPFLLFAMVACAAGTVGTPSGSTNVISRAELDASGTANAFDTIKRLRPQFLRDRGPTTLLNQNARARPVVFVDGNELGEVESLTSVPASRIEEVRFFSGPEAVTKFGSQYGAGVIQLKMRVQ